MQILKRLTYLLLLIAGLSQFSVTAAPRPEDDSGAKFATFNVSNLAFDFVAPADVATNFSEFNFDLNDAGTYDDDTGFNFKLQTTGDGHAWTLFLPNMNSTNSNNNVQNCEGAISIAMGGPSWTCVILQIQASVAKVANSATYDTTITTGDFHDDVGHFFSKNFDGDNINDNPDATRTAQTG